MNVSKDLVAASAPLIVLSILMNNDSYGYEIIKQVEQLSSSRWQWSEGMLYPILHRLEKSGWIESYWQSGAGNRRRKYYRVLDAGRRSFDELCVQWDFVATMIDRIRPQEG